MPTTSPRTGLKAAIASAAAVALLSTGAAFAASGHAPWAGSAAGRPTAVPSHSHPTDDPSETVSDDPSESGDTDAPDGDGSAGPNEHAFPGLCRAYAAGNKTEQGDALSSPAFTALVAAAGGPDAVADFCVALAPTHTHPAEPSHPQPTHTVPPHPGPTHSAHTHPAVPSHPGSTHPSSDSHPSRP